jgi:hypothetical protein
VARNVNLTKLAVAEQEIVAAVRLLFDGGDLAPVYVLAASAREIATTLCEVRGVKSFFDEAREVHPHIPKKEMYRQAHRHAGFFKHADRDPDAVLTDFTDSEVDTVLFAAIFDFGSLCGGLSIEAQVFEGWFLTLYWSAGDIIPMPTGLDELFPNLRERPRFDQLALGGQVLRWARTVPNFKMSYSLELRPAK